MDLRDKTIKGTGWSILSQVVRLVIRFGIVAVLARLLTPDDFGLLAMATVFTSLLLVLNELGIPSAIIQRKDISNIQLSSSFWLNLGEGLFVSIVFAAIAPLIALFYSEERLLPIIIVLSPMFFIASFGMIQYGLLSKRMNFKSLAIAEITAAGFAGVIAVVLAYAGTGVWSLVFQTLTGAFILSILFWLLCDWHPSMAFKWRETKEILNYGLFLTGFQFVNYFNRNLDNLLIGRFLGAEALGFYDIAYRILLFPLQNISAVVGRVMFPALSIIQEDLAKVRGAYIAANRYIAAITFPICTLILITAPQFTRVILGNQWERSIFVIQVLAIVALIQSITYTVGWLYLSQGKTKILFLWGIITAIVYASAFAVGLLWDIEGVAVAYAIAVFLLIYPCFAIPFKFIEMKFLNFLRYFITVLVATIISGILSLSTRFIMQAIVSLQVLILVTTLVVGVISYCLALFLIDRNLCSELTRVIKAFKP